MTLTGDSFRQFRDVLLEAFNVNSLRSMVRIELEVALETIVAPGHLQARVEGLIQWAERNGRLEELLAGAQAVVPTNKRLAAVTLAYLPRSAQTAERPQDNGDSIEVGDIKDTTGVAIGHGASVTINQYITADEAPELFSGVPDFPRHGLVGRDDLLNRLVERLAAGGSVSLSLTGTGGVGKTALAVAAAYRTDLLAHFGDGVLWASVGPQGDPQLALGRWAQALGLDPRQYPEPGALKRAVKDAVGQRRLLLVLDDLWEADQAEMLRCGGPFCAHLLTTRQKSLAGRFAGGRAGALTVPELDPDPAFMLLQASAAGAVAADVETARQLVRQVGGLPLALELLAGFLTAEGVPDPDLFPDLGRERLEALADPAVRLQQAGAKLEDMSGEQVRLNELLALSLDGFSDEERAFFYALGAFAPKPAAFSRAAAEAVSTAGGAFLSRLVNRNLLEIADKALTLHQTLHDLAHESMEKLAQERHAGFYLALVNDDRGNWQRIDAAYEQIRWAWERVDDDACLAWVYALRDHQVKRGYWKETAVWQERGLAAARSSGKRNDEAWLLNNLAGTYDDLGQRGEALVLYEEALLIMRAVGDRAGEAATLNNMAAVYFATGRPAQALALYEEALSINRELGDRDEVATTLNNMAVVYYGTGRLAQALALYEELLSISREMGDRAGEALMLNNMGSVYRAMDRPAEALALFEEALPIRRAVGDRAGEAATLNNIGMVYRVTDRPAEALALYEEVLVVVREVGQHTWEASTLNNMALVHEALGRPAEALTLYEESLPIRRAVGDRAGEAATLWNAAVLLRRLERPSAAIARLEQAVALFRGGLTHDSTGSTVEKYEELQQALQNM